MRGRSEFAIYARAFCELTGLKTDTLRFYVDKGLLSPGIDPYNHYKTYSPTDVVDMFYVRSRRALGVPIDGINEVLTKMPLQTQKSWLAAHEKHLLDEIAQLQLQLHLCKRAERDLQRLNATLGQIIDQTAAEGPDLAQINLLGPEVKMYREACRLAERWREVYPHILPMIHVPLAQLQDESLMQYDVTFGVAAAVKYFDKTPELLSPPVYFYPTHHCVSMLVCLKDPFNLTRADLEPLFDYIKQKHYHFSDSLTSWLVTKSREDDGDRYYFTLRVSVEEN